MSLPADLARTEEIRRRFGDLNVWKQGDQRAPHKPLLLLLTLARIARGGPRLIEYPHSWRTLSPAEQLESAPG